MAAMGNAFRIQRLLAGRELRLGQVAENERQPGAPDEELEHHHQEELDARGHG